jgi:hypothetical protein
MATKYKISEKDFTKHGIAKLERDGFTRETIMKTMYEMTPGVSQKDRTKLVQDTFNRREK